MTKDEIVFSVTLGAACFSFGLGAGLYLSEEIHAVQLQPCPKNGQAKLVNIKVDGQVCTYAEIVKGGRKIKWEVKTL